jgi:predicted RecA/RadA family phage recombinase
MQATRVYDDAMLSQPYTPGSDTEPGTIVKVSDGRAGVVAGVDKIPASATGRVFLEGIYDMPIASATVIAANAEVGWDESAGVVLAASAGASDYPIGKTRGGSADGETVIRVELNAHRYDGRNADNRVVAPGMIWTGPTSDPSVAGVVYSDSGVLTVSAG